MLPVQPRNHPALTPAVPELAYSLMYWLVLLVEKWRGPEAEESCDCTCLTATSASLKAFDKPLIIFFLLANLFVV